MTNRSALNTAIIIAHALTALHTFTHALFSFKPTYIPANGVVLYEDCIDATQRLKENNFTSTYVRITDHDNLWHLQNGIQVEGESVTLYSRGFRGGNALIGPFLFRTLNHAHAFRTVYKYIKLGSIQCPTVGFDYIDTIDNFDHGCTIRANRLQSILESVQQQSKNIILFGDSIGAKTILYLATYNPLHQVKALVLESPIFDLENMVQNEAKHDFWWLANGKESLYKSLCTILHQYKSEHDLSYEKLETIPVDIPIFFAHLHNDKLIDNQTAKNMVNALRDSGHTVYFLVVDNPEKSHAHVAATDPFVKAINAFYKAHNLAHSTQLAQEGQDILERALQNTQQDTIQHIEMA